jgi:hypothetical protein
MKRSDSKRSHALIAIGVATVGLAGAVIGGHALFVLGRNGAWFDVAFVAGVLVLVVALVRGLTRAAAGSFEHGWKNHHRNDAG